jgi:putative component of membrane protein insertase Oxa1/YidC/SpoIIIJ protein YidD
MYPSCSRYAMQAVAQEGPIRGTWLSAARVLHSHNDPADPICLIGRRTFRYHPPEVDAWWR